MQGSGKGFYEIRPEKGLGSRSEAFGSRLCSNNNNNTSNDNHVKSDDDKNNTSNIIILVQVVIAIILVIVISIAITIRIGFGLELRGLRFGRSEPVECGLPRECGGSAGSLGIPWEGF